MVLLFRALAADVLNVNDVTPIEPESQEVGDNLGNLVVIVGSTCCPVRDDDHVRPKWCVRTHVVIVDVEP